MTKLKDLAQFFKYKHFSQLVKGAQNVKKITPLMLVKDELANAYRLYVDPKTAKEPILQILADAGEPFSQDLLSNFNLLISSLDKLSAKDLFHLADKILGKINKVKNDSKKEVRNSIHNAFRLHKQFDIKQREHYKSKFEMILLRLSSILEKSVKKLQQISKLEGPLEGTTVEPQRKELNKEKIFWFMKTPIAQHYGLDSEDVMTQLLQYPNIKQKLTTLINAIDRGHIPVDGPEVAELASEMKHWLDNQIETNKPSLDLPPLMDNKLLIDETEKGVK